MMSMRKTKTRKSGEIYDVSWYKGAEMENKSEAPFKIQMKLPFEGS